MYVDCEKAFACELKLEDKYVFHHVYFYTENCFIGCRNISPTVQEIATYQIEIKEGTGQNVGLMVNLRASLKLNNVVS